ncbi:amidase signature enzyme [Calocera viscosa TUFC12733]|uniref:Amidase signature enzyme n=1 Tax=Calocera viscosa (strain TUFC12733) TaxID=1330018 RepID=A0A167GV94_CALVF|nr:amidase signature enzyme [Calocera viscosa TUFC12733]
MSVHAIAQCRHPLALPGKLVGQQRLCCPAKFSLVARSPRSSLAPAAALTTPEIVALVHDEKTIDAAASIFGLGSIRRGAHHSGRAASAKVRKARSSTETSNSTLSSNAATTIISPSPWYLVGIPEVNPVLRAVIETNLDVVAVAAQLDTERKNGSVMGIIHGIPNIFKDNIATLDKMNPTVTRMRLKAAEAIILANAGLCQSAKYRYSNSTNGWTSRGAQIMGRRPVSSVPFLTRMFALISCSRCVLPGSGMCSSIDIAAAAHGAETSGSITGPSQRNSLTGIKPTVGLTSHALVVPISHAPDTLAPMMRTMKDAAYIQSVIVGKDAQAAFNQTLKLFKPLGTIITESADFPNLAEYRASSNTTNVLHSDFKYDIADYFEQKVGRQPNQHHQPCAAHQLYRALPAEGYSGWDVARWIGAANLTWEIGSAEYWAAAAQADSYLEQEATILGWLEKDGLDALINLSSMSPTYAAIAGYPILRCRMATTHRAPS